MAAPGGGRLKSDIYPFQYKMDRNTLASIDSPATKEVGEFVRLCGKEVLYADGHVLWVPIQEGAGTFPGWPNQ